MALSSNWQELSVDDAAELLAARVTVVGLRTKQAADPQTGMFDQMVPPAGKTLDWLNPLKDPMVEGAGPNKINTVTGQRELDPFWGTARSGVVGAGLGLGLGGLQALMTPSRKRRWLHSLLSGALMGGGVGLGAGAAMNYGGQATGDTRETMLAKVQQRKAELAAEFGKQQTPDRREAIAAEQQKTDQEVARLTALAPAADAPAADAPTPAATTKTRPRYADLRANGATPTAATLRGGANTAMDFVEANPGAAVGTGVGGLIGSGGTWGVNRAFGSPHRVPGPAVPGPSVPGPPIPNPHPLATGGPSMIPGPHVPGSHVPGPRVPASPSQQRWHSTKRTAKGGVRGNVLGLLLGSAYDHFNK